MTTVALLPPLTTSGGPWPGEPLTEARPYLRTRRMSRWHEPRSGYRLDRQDRTIVDLWCGQTINDLAKAIACDTPPAGDPACGSCAGRRAGAAGEDGLVFSPWTLEPPSTCPGWREHYERLPGGRTGRCLTCGAVERLWGVGGYNFRVVITHHGTGPDLVDPCPFHAWRTLMRDPTASTPTLVCSCRRQRIYDL